MASKAIYMLIAFSGIALASAVAWSLQHSPAPVNSPSGLAATSAVAGASSSSAPSAGKPPTVEVAKVELARLSEEAQAIGSLRSRRGVVLRPEVSGRLTQLNFTDGQRVRKGQLLVQLDDQLQQAQVQQSQAELSIAKANQKRNQELVEQGFISQRSLDESAANLQVAQAKLALSLASAARLKILAPFDGIAGIRLVNVGDYLKDGADIINIEDIDAVFVDFRLPERFQNKLKTGQTALLNIDALQGEKFTATISAIDPLIDANGRSVSVRACIDNRRLQLRPGMFARVNTVFAVREQAMVIPEEALLPQGGRQFVIRLINSVGTGESGQAPKSSQVSQKVEVKLGLRSPGRVEILQGLENGDTVVTTGQQRLPRDGMAVTVVDVAARATRSGPAGLSAPASASASASASAAPGAANPAPSTIKSDKNAAADATLKPLATALKSVGPNPCGLPV
jgi:membrane fusion protein (multidrug efflux system)